MKYDVNNVDTTNLDQLNDALQHLHFAFRAVVLEVDTLLASKKMGRAHHRILFMIARRKQVSTTGLMEILGITRQALHRPLRELVNNGYVVSRTSPDYWRMTMHSLTRKGVALEQKLSGMQRAQLAAAFASAGPAAEAHWCDIMKVLGAPLREKAESAR